MDGSKKKTLIKWLDALCDGPVKSLQQLLDGVNLISVLHTAEVSLPARFTLDTVQSRFDAIKYYIESVYNQQLSDSLINFKLILRQNASREILDLELGKLLLALLGGLVQDKCREKIIQPALSMDPSSQMEIRDMIEFVVCMHGVDTQLPDGFAETLKKKTDPCAHHDAALFFKLVADGLNNSVSEPSTTTSSAHTSNNGPPGTMYSYSPQGPHNTSIRDISSPMRTLSLASMSSSPLGALMQSPQLAQKAMMRQKTQEIRHLGEALERERHLRSELELDLEERSKRIEQKDARVRELEVQLSEVRRMRDQIDELDSVRALNEQLNKDLGRLQNRIRELQDIKEYCAVVEKENKEIVEDLRKSNEEIKMLKSLSASGEEYKVLYHKQQIDMCEFNAKLDHREEELTELRQGMYELQNRLEMAQQQCSVLKQEKEELEEMLATSNPIGGMEPQFTGESMSIVTDKRMSELQSEFDHIKSTWIEPSKYQRHQNQLEQESQAKTAFEEKYFDVKKKLLATDGELEKLTNSVNMYQSEVSKLEADLKESQEKELSLDTQVKLMQASLEQVKSAEAELRSDVEAAYTRICRLEDDKSHLQAEVQLSERELEVQSEASESRRLTILQLDSTKMDIEKQGHRLSSELEIMKKKVTDQEKLVQQLKADLSSREETLKSKLTSVTDTYNDKESRLQAESVEKESEIKELKEKLNSQRKTASQRQEELESQVNEENNLNSEHTTTIKALSEEIDELKNSALQKEESLNEELASLTEEKKQLDLELHRLNLEHKASTEKLSTKCFKLETQVLDVTSSSNEEIRTLNAKKEKKEKMIQELREQISVLNGHQQKQKNEIEKLMKEIVQLKSNNRQINDSYESSQRTVVDLQVQLKSVKEELDGDKEQSSTVVAVGNATIQELKSTLDNLTETYCSEKWEFCLKIKELESNISCQSEEFSATKDSFHAELCSVEMKNKEMEDQLKKEHETIVELETKLQASNSASDSLQKQVTNLESLVQEKESVAERASQEWHAKKTILENNISCQSEDFSATKDSFHAELCSVEMKNKEIEDQLKKEHETIVELETKLQAAYGASDSLQKQVTNLESLVQEKESAAERASQEWHAKKTILENNISCQSEEFSATKDSFHAELCSVEMKNKEMEDQLKNEHEGIVELKTELQAAYCASDSLQKQVTNLESLVQEKESAAERASQEWHAKKTILENNISCQSEDFSATKDSFHAELCSVEMKNKEIEDQLKKEHETIVELETKLQAAYGASDSLQKQVTNLESLVQEKESAAERASQEWHAKKTILENNISCQSEDFSATKDSFHAELCSVEMKNKEMEDQLKNEHEGIVELKTELQAAYCASDSLQKQVTNLESLVQEKESAAERASQEWHAKKTILENNISCQSEDFSATKDSFHAELCSVEMKNKEIEHQLKNEHEGIVELKTKLQAAYGASDSLQKQVTNLESLVQEKESAAERASQEWHATLEAKNEKIKQQLEQLNHLEESEKILRAADCVSQGDIQKQIKEISVLKNQMEVTIEEKESLESALAAEKSDVNSLTLQLKNTFEELETTQKEVASITARLARVEENKSELEAMLLGTQSDGETQRHTLEARMQQLIHAKDELHCRVSELHQRNKDLETALSDSQAQLETKTQAFETKSSEFVEQKASLEEKLENALSSLESNQAAFSERMVDTESYWRSQLEQLEEEYSKGTEEQKEEYQRHLTDQEERYENLRENLTDEKDMYIASETQAFRERFSGLEKVLSEHKDELKEALAKLDEERQKGKAMSEDFGNRLVASESALNLETDNNVSLVKELEQSRLKLDENEKENRKEVELLIGQYETQLETLQTELTSSGKQLVVQLKADHQSDLAELQASMQEKKTEFESVVSQLEENLSSQAEEMKERLSQQRCQYETTLETKQKEQRGIVRDLEHKVTALLKEKTGLEETLKEMDSLQEELVKEKMEHAGVEEQLRTLEKRNTELEAALNLLQSQFEEMKAQLLASNEKLEGQEKELASVTWEIGRVKNELAGERGEKCETEMQVKCLQERNDTLTAELSSQQQQLAAVEEETRVLELEKIQLIEKYEQINVDLRASADRQFKFLEIEKVELERQLQSSQKCYETVQRSESELERKIEKMDEERRHMEKRCRELEQRVYNYMEREQKMNEANQYQTTKAAEFNGKLRRQLDEKTAELEAANAKTKEIKQELDREIDSMKELLCTRDKQLTGVNKDLETATKTIEQIQSEKQKLQDTNNKYNIYYNKKKEDIVNLTKDKEELQQQLNKLNQSKSHLKTEWQQSKAKLEAELSRNKTLHDKLLKYESNDFLGDNSHFMEMMKVRENPVNASFMANHPPTGLMNSSSGSDDGYYLRSRRSSQDSTVTSDSLSDETVIPPARARRSRKTSTLTIDSNAMAAETTSIGSASSLAFRVGSRESKSSLNKSFSSTDTGRSILSVPVGTGRNFFCEDEPAELEFGRLGELQRRNTLCLPHLKTSYPVETQRYKPKEFSDRALRESTMGNSTLVHADGSGKKRKMERERSQSSSTSNDSRSKLAKTNSAGTVYQKPGPPTPANSRRNSAKGSKSPRTPSSSQSRHSLKLTSKQTPKTNSENPGSSKSSKRDSVAYSIGFSPQTSSKRLTRQNCFVQKQPQSASKTRKPLGVRNYLQTGL